MSSYSIYHKKYYSENKTDIINKNKDTKYAKNYYEKNKDEIKKKALVRYYLKKQIKEVEENENENKII
jgi:hypothetical protein